ncbi:bacteriocin [Enterococcus faecalis]
MKQFKELSVKEMQQVSGGGWQTMSFTPNMECWNGVLKTGNCRVKWDVVANQAVNNVTSAMVGGFGRGR